MGTILESTNELAKRFGVEGEMTIKDTLDAIVKKLDDTYTDSKDIAEAVAEFSKNDGPDARLDTKSITENGTYAALDDDLDGYSSVTVDVTELPKYSMASSVTVTRSGGVDTVTIGRTAAALWPIASGEFTLRYKANYDYTTDPDTFVLLAPASKIQDAIISPAVKILFTPSADFDGFYTESGDKLTLTGDEITPGDGKTYVFYRLSYANDNYISKKDIDFKYTYGDMPTT